MGVYGNFLTAFPELMRRITVWTNKDKSDKRDIRGILVDDTADGLRRKKFTSSNTAIDIYEDAILYTDIKYRHQIAIGDYLYHPDHKYIMRVCHEREYNYAAGYEAWDIEKLGGTSPDQDKNLEVKEAHFA